MIPCCKVGESNMKPYNFKEFYTCIEKGFISKNKTNICKILFEPLFCFYDLCDDEGNPYEIDNNNASKWSSLKSAIPNTIREAVIKDKYYKNIIQYYKNTFFNEIKDDSLKYDMLDSLFSLINESDLEVTRKNNILDAYNKQNWSDFVSLSFIAAIIYSDKKIKPSNDVNDSIPNTLVDFQRVISQKYQKPVSIPVPQLVGSEEMTYVKELYKAYTVTSGKKIDSQDSLGEYKKHFDRQRKNYYLAETIHREIRDTITPGEESGFNTLKDEIESGIETALDESYSTPVKKIDEVTEKAAYLPISDNTSSILLGWIGAAEKKGVCHMLANEERIKWVDDESETD